MSSLNMVEDRLFRRGVSDAEVQQALGLLQGYVTEHLMDTSSDREWWEHFEDFFNELTRSLSPRQLIAMEVAADTLLIHSGIQPWSLARAALAVARRRGEGAKDAPRETL